MKIIRDLSELDLQGKKSVVTLGDFDGIHRGHCLLIHKTIHFAKKYNLVPVLLTYYPSPKKLLKKIPKENTALFTQEEKLELLKKFELEYVIILDFNIKLVQMKASSFLKNILLEKIKARYILLGYDHHFGKNRHGNYTYLRLASKRYGFEVKQFKAVSLFSIVISSKKIRHYLQTGSIEKTNKFLGFTFYISGIVVHGLKRGTSIEVPTINININKEKIIPKQGVYMGYVVYQNETYKCVMNLGTNPTFNNQNISLEAHILNFSKDIYGEYVQIHFLKYIRREKTFKHIHDLKKQIKNDIEYASRIKI